MNKFLFFKKFTIILVCGTITMNVKDSDFLQAQKFEYGGSECNLKDMRLNTQFTDCQLCYRPLQYCHCVCPYCAERDRCECALFDACTGG